MSSSNPRLSTEVMREAAAWITRLSGPDATALDHRELVEWLKRSPVHVHHYLELVGLDVDLADPALYEGMSPDHPGNEPGSNVLSWTTPNAVHQPYPSLLAHPQPGRRRWLRGIAAAAVIVAALGLVFAVRTGIDRQPGQNRYHSAVGELRSIALDDGSIVTLNTQSEIEVSYSQAARTVELVNGEALFRVIKNRNRPFRVVVDGVVVQAVGTEFNIYRRPSGAVVTVVEGRVAVLPQIAASTGSFADSERSADSRLPRAPVELSAGDQLAIVPNPTVRRLEPTELAQVTTWTQRRLIFNQAPVSAVVSELNRYNSEQLAVDDPAIARRGVTGTFESNDVESFILFLQQEGGVAVRAEPDGTRHLIATARSDK